MLPFFLIRRLFGGRRRRDRNCPDDVTYRTVYVMPGAPQQPGLNDPPPAYYPQDPALQHAYYPPQKTQKVFGRRRRCCR